MPRQRLSRQESRRQTRAQLLAAAAQVFAEKGFNGASVEDIAETAGYSKGAVYSNFESKEDLFLALIDQYLAVELEKLGDSIDLPLWEAEFERDLTENRTLKLLTVEFFLYAMRNESARQKLAQRYRVAYAALAQMMGKHYQQANLPQPMSAQHLAWAITSVGTGLFLQTCLDPDALPEAMYMTALKRILYGHGEPNAAQLTHSSKKATELRSRD
ncbi:MAG: TetR/AcrR family transcriptional regulator [Leptolyngbya sp. LCM1.Bin17]|nr:MAG: TetR/AcrR family transcriptional regulator [Leptolyngbya sp. LCM1.Bin17]